MVLVSAIFLEKWHETMDMVKGNSRPADIFTLFFYTVSGRVSILISVSVTSMKHRTFYAG
jgi:hypothetical protein